jgi:hypothetical protein
VAIPCNVCGKPVHSQAVICPHCGEPTGVAADPTLTGEEAVAAVELARIQADTYVAPLPLTGSGYGGYDYEPELALIGGAAVAAFAVGAVVKSVVEAVVEERGAHPELPQAIARERTPLPVAPVSSHEPEPAPPPAAQPRFLK